MIPTRQQKVFPFQNLGPTPSERFVTTYSSDYKPLSKLYPWFNQPKPGTEARADPAVVDPSQTVRETWPVFHRYFYKTTNSIYGSDGCSQPPPSSLSSSYLFPFDTFAPSLCESCRVVGPDLTGAGTPDVEVARESGPLLGREERDQLRYVFVREGNVSEQQEAKDEPQKNVDVHYEEGVIMLSSRVGPACCEDFLTSVCREAGLWHLLRPPVTASPIITIEDAPSWDNSTYLRGWGPATGLKNSTFLQPTSRQCSCGAWETECPDSCCFKMQSFSRGSAPPLAPAQPAVCYTEPSRKPWVTEYQNSYSAAWTKPEIQQSDPHHRHPPRHQTRYASL